MIHPRVRRRTRKGIHDRHTDAGVQPRRLAPPEPGRVERKDEPRSARTRRTTGLVVAIALILAVALFIFMITRAARGDDARPRSASRSTASSSGWANSARSSRSRSSCWSSASSSACILLLIEYAPRAGRFYFWLRLAACFADPGLAFMLLRPYQNAVIYVLAIAVILGGVLFYADYRSRQGAGYLFQLVIFAAPAAILLAHRPHLPGDRDHRAVVLRQDRRRSSSASRTTSGSSRTPRASGRSSTRSSGCCVAPTIATDRSASPTRSSSTGPRGEKCLKILIFMPFAISFVGAGIIWKFVVRLPPGRADRCAQRHRHRVRRRAGVVARRRSR